MFDTLLKTKYWIQFGKKVNEGFDESGHPRYVYDYAGKTRISPLLTEIIYKNRPIRYNMTEVSWRKGNKAYIYKDIDNGQTILKMGSDDWHCPTDPQKFKTQVQIAKNALANGEKPNYGLVVVIAIGLACLMGGIILGNYLPAITGAIQGAV